MKLPVKLSILLSKLNRILARYTRKRRPASSSDKALFSSGSDPYVDHTVIMKPEQASLLFKKINESKAGRRAKKEQLAEEDTLADYIPGLQEATENTPVDDDVTDKDIPALKPGRTPRRREGVKRPFKFSTAFFGASSGGRTAGLLWIFPALAAILLCESTWESFLNGFFFRWFYLIGSLALLVLGGLTARLTLRSASPQKTADSAVLFFSLVLSMWLAFFILSLGFYSPYDPYALTLFRRPLDESIHIVLFSYLLVIGIGTLAAKPMPRPLRILFPALFLYPLVIWGMAIWMRTYPESLFLRLSPFTWLPPLYAQPLHMTALVLVPLLLVFLCLQAGIAFIYKRPTRHLLPLSLLVLFYIGLGLAVVRGYLLPLSPFGHLGAVQETTHAFAIEDLREGSPQMSLRILGKPRSAGAASLHILDDAQWETSGKVTIPLAVRDAWGHRVPFLNAREFRLYADGQEVKGARVSAARASPTNDRAKEIYVLIALDDAHAPLLKQVKLALADLVAFKNPRDEIGFFLFGTNETRILFSSQRDKLMATLTSLQHPNGWKADGFSQELGQLLKSVLTQKAPPGRESQEVHIALFTTETVLNNADIQEDLLTLGSKKRVSSAVFGLEGAAVLDPKIKERLSAPAVRFFPGKDESDLLRASKHWIAKLYRDYTLSLDPSLSPYTVSWKLPDGGLSVRNAANVEVDLYLPLQKTLKKVEFIIDGELVQNLTDPETLAGTTRFRFPNRELPEGDHPFSIRIQIEGAKVYTSEREIHVRPLGDFKILYPGWGDAVSGRVPIQLSLGSLAPEEIERVQFSVNDVMLGEVTHEPFVYTWDVPSGESGLSYLSAKAFLRNGSNVEDKIEVGRGAAFRIAFASPSIGQYVGRVLPIELTLDKAGGETVKSIAFFLDEAPISPVADAGNPLAFRWKLPPELTGKHVLRAVASAGSGLKTSSVVPIQVGTAEISLRGETSATGPAEGGNGRLFTAPSIYWIIDSSEHFSRSEGYDRFQETKSALLSQIDRFSGEVRWSLAAIGGKRPLPHSSCGDYSFSFKLGESDLTRSILTLKPRGETPLFAALRTLFSKHRFDEASRLLLVLGGIDTCDSYAQPLFSSERVKSKLFPKLSARLIVPYTPTAKEEGFFSILAHSLQGKTLILKPGVSIKDLVDDGMSYELSIFDKDGEPVWNGPFKEMILTLPMGAYDYSLGPDQSAAKGSFSLKNGERAVWTVKASPDQNPPYTIEATK